MTPEELLSILHTAEKLKRNTRHCDTTPGRRESVADHSWRLALTAMLLSSEYPDLDMDKVIRMCLIHDLGEAFTGDIPTFDKTEAQGEAEAALYRQWVEGFPEPDRSRWLGLLTEMEERQTGEARLYKALDKMEAVISHNESEISSWIPLEYDLQLTYGEEETGFSEYTRALKAAVDRETRRKIREGK